MVTLEFTTPQIEELKNYYKTELDRLLTKAVETQKIIERLDVHSSQETASISALKDLIARGEKVELKKISDAPEERKTIKVSGKKEKLNKKVKVQDVQESTNEEGSEKKDAINGKWIDLIVSVLKEKASPMTKKEILKEILKRTKQSKSKKIDTAVTMSIYRLRAIRKEVISAKIERKGKRSTMYSLASATYIPTESEVVAIPTKKEKKIAAKILKSKPITKKRKKDVKIEKPTKVAKLVKAAKPDRVSKKVKAAKPVRVSKKVKAAKADKTSKDPNKEKSRSVLTEFVVSSFHSSNKIMQAKEIVNLAIKKFNIPEENEEKKGQLRVTIAGILYRGEKTHGTIRSYKEKNLRGAYYGLAEWFNADGSLQEDKKL